MSYRSYEYSHSVHTRVQAEQPRSSKRKLESLFPQIAPQYNSNNMNNVNESVVFPNFNIPTATFWREVTDSFIVNITLLFENSLN